MKIYTKTGDQGDTGLWGGTRIGKHHPRIETIGSVDELNCTLGVIRTQSLPQEIDELIASIQHRLFDLGAELANEKAAENQIFSQEAQQLEASIDHFEGWSPPLRQFILPGGTPAAAWLHLARAVCRRAEREAVGLFQQQAELAKWPLVVYLNRLSDLLFVLARAANHQAGQPDIPWQAKS